MPKHYNKRDLLRRPIDIAAQLGRFQIESFVQEFSEDKQRPVVQALHDRGLRLKGVLAGLRQARSVSADTPGDEG